MSTMNRRILVADDSSTIQKVIKIALARYQTEIIEASSFVEALAAVSRSAPDVLVMDASLPGANSPADFSRLSEQAGQAPVLLLIGTYEAVDETQFRQAGFQNFLKKPFESSDIVAAIDKLTMGSLSSPTSETTVAPGRHAHATVVMSGAFPGLPPEEDDKMPELSLDLPGGLSVPPPPPQSSQSGIKTEEGRKGRRAFAANEGSGSSLSGARASGGSAVPPPPGRAPASAPAGFGSGGGGVSLNLEQGITGLEGLLDAGGLDARLPALVRAAVEDYCERHFKSLAREIIAGELRRLADEKARHLVDN